MALAILWYCKDFRGFLDQQCCMIPTLINKNDSEVLLYIAKCAHSYEQAQPVLKTGQTSLFTQI